MLPALAEEPVPCSNACGNRPQGPVQARTWKTVSGHHIPLAHVLSFRVYFHIKWGRMAGEEPERCLPDNFLQGGGGARPHFTDYQVIVTHSCLF